MAVRKILTIEQRILRAKAKRVTRYGSQLERLVRDMWETLDAVHGAGLAAPQIGESIRVFVAQYEGQRVALVNPEIVKRSKEELLGREGCLSIPGFAGDNIRRAASILVKGRDQKGKELRIRAEGWFARIIQHEIDHLDGILYIDRLDRREDLLEVLARDEVEQDQEHASSEQRVQNSSNHVAEKSLKQAMAK